MRGISFAVLVSIFVGLGTSSALQPPGGGGGKKGGGQPGQGKGPPQGQGQGRLQFELGKVLPPNVAEAMNLTDEQKKAIAALEADVKTKLQKILTAEQIQQLTAGRQQGPMGGQGGPPGGGQGGLPGGGQGGPPGGGGGQRKPGGEPVSAIQWFATWESAKAEAQRLGLPIMLVSAAPHCSGISGIW